tara:strand:+ start:765 stop:1544 length:780 start_codon:yes stop_codon:yes gene_type:complete
MPSDSPVVLASTFKIENVSFKEPKKNAVGGQSVLLNYWNENTRKNGPLLLQTPKMRMPFGPDISTAENGGKRYSVNTSLAHTDSPNLNLKQFTEIIRVLDEFTKKFAVDNSEMWFGKKQKIEVIEEFYKSAEKKSKNDKYPSTIKLKLPVKMVGTPDSQKPVPQFEIYDDSKNNINVVVEHDIDLSCLEKGADIIGLIQCTGVWFVGKTQLGLGWKIVQVKTFKSQKIVGYSIVDEDETVEEEEEEEVEVEVEDGEEVG